MKLLHTADWHVGKRIRGRSRADEHQEVLSEIVELAADHAVDAVLVAGDLFDGAAPGPEAEALVYRTLLELSETGATVVVIAGNHDHPRRLEAVAPLLELGRVRVVAEPRAAADGGVQELTTDGGARLRLALVPFVSRRGIVRIDDLMGRDADDHAGSYRERMRRVVATLCAGFDDGADDAVNVVVAHAMTTGGVLGGGERQAHTIFEYEVPASVFPTSAHYVALGHLHRTQSLPGGGGPVWYPGSPLQLDFGEERDDKNVLLVEAEPGVPARVDPLPLRSGRRLRTVEGSLEALARQAENPPDEGRGPWLRVRVHERPRPGLAEEVRDLFPDVVAIEVEQPDEAGAPARPTRIGRSPHELFAEYLAEHDSADDAVLALFDELHDEVTG
jgi:exonuclease SbcD